MLDYCSNLTCMSVITSPSNTYYHIFLNFIFYIGVWLINSVLLVSGVQQSDSIIHVHVSILFQILFPFRLLHNIEQSSLCYTVGPCWLSILNIAAYYHNFYATFRLLQSCFPSYNSLMPLQISCTLAKLYSV